MTMTTGEQMTYTPNTKRIVRWKKLRRQIDIADNEQRKLELLRSFGDEIRLYMTAAGKAATVDKDDIVRAQDIATIHGAILGAWLDFEPANPQWPGRDRLFVFRRDDLITTCSVLAALGCFPTEKIGEIVDYIESSGSRAYVPGIEAPGVPPDAIPELLWDSAVNSAKSKKQWQSAKLNQSKWADEKWAAMPGVWRTCAFLDTADPVTEQCRDLPVGKDDDVAGLVAFVKTPRSDANDIADSWLDRGWDAAVINRSDCLGLYNLISTTSLEKPLVVLITVGDVQASARNISKTIVKRRESGLLGEMSDDQFFSIIEESL